MIEAELYLDDFDGIIAGDPALGDEIAGFNCNDQALFKTPHFWLSPQKHGARRRMPHSPPVIAFSSLWEPSLVFRRCFLRRCPHKQCCREE
jgi:hypothetical protein